MVSLASITQFENWLKANIILTPSELRTRRDGIFNKWLDASDVVVGPKNNVMEINLATTTNGHSSRSVR